MVQAVSQMQPWKRAGGIHEASDTVDAQFTVVSQVGAMTALVKRPHCVRCLQDHPPREVQLLQRLLAGG